MVGPNRPQGVTVVVECGPPGRRDEIVAEEPAPTTLGNEGEIRPDFACQSPTFVGQLNMEAARRTVRDLQLG